LGLVGASGQWGIVVVWWAGTLVVRRHRPASTRLALARRRRSAAVAQVGANVELPSPPSPPTSATGRALTRWWPPSEVRWSSMVSGAASWSWVRSSDSYRITAACASGSSLPTAASSGSSSERVPTCSAPVPAVMAGSGSVSVGPSLDVIPKVMPTAYPAARPLTRPPGPRPAAAPGAGRRSPRQPPRADRG